jgi:beta-lactamase superfamily II metal-dependent hydrolase
MKLQIFDVEHGACALLTCDNGGRIMIDCGHNGTTGWRPGSYLRSIGVTRLEKLVVTNFDEDHVSGIENLLDHVLVGTIKVNSFVSTADIRWLKTVDGMGPGIERLVWELENSFTTRVSPGDLGMPAFPGVKEQYFGHAYPRDFDDENNLSLVARLNCYGINIMFPGDLEKPGWVKMLTVPGFPESLPNMDLLVASHHGRESGCAEEIFSLLEPTFVIISDKSKGYQTQETTGWYASRARGGIFNGESGRKVVTTRSDGDLVIHFGDCRYNFRKDETRPTAEQPTGLAAALQRPRWGELYPRPSPLGTGNWLAPDYRWRR